MFQKMNHGVRLCFVISICLVLLLSVITGMPTKVYAAGNGTTVGTLTLVPTIECIGVTATFTNDDDQDNSAVLEYREVGAGSWKTAHQMYADRGRREYRGSIFWLTTNTDYEVRVTYTDADGVTGSNPVMGTTKTRNDNPPSNGNTYYVATNGSDSSPGTEAQPFRTIQKAADTVAAGGTVLVKAGTYSSGASVTTSGSADNYITFKNYGSDTPIIDGGDEAFFVEARFIRIKGFRCQNQYGSAITINAEHASAGDVIVEDCVIVNPNRNNTGSYGGIGLYYGASNCIIQRNHITIQGYANDKQGVAYWKAGDGHVFRDNVVVGIPHDGFGGGPENSHGYMRNCDYYNNYVENAQDDGISIEGDDINVRIWGNTMINCFMSVAVCPVMIGPAYVFRNVMNAAMTRDLGNGGAMKLGDGSEGPIYLYHNTAYTNENGCDGPFATNAGLANVTSRNNIFHATWYIVEFGHDWDAENHDFDYDNLYSTNQPTRFIKWGQARYTTLEAFQSDTGQEQHGMSVADSGFVDANNDDYTLREDSPCRDKGVVLVGFNDQNSPWPYQGSAPDLGAYEYDSGTPTNNPPVLAAIGDKSVNEEQLLQFTISATDPDGDTLTYSASNLPSGANFNAGTHTFSWTPAIGQAGSYPNVHFEVTDGELTDDEDITITVSNGNNPPVLGIIGNRSVDEGQLLSFTISATDPDGDTLTYSASNLPSGASFNADTRTFSWTPTYTQAGTYANVHFQVSDGTLTDSEDITITVVNVNRPPVLSAIGNRSVDEGQILSFTVSATDPDGGVLTYSASNLPSGASFNAGTRTFSWTPTYSQAGTYANVHFQVSDGTLTDSEDITITVVNVNRPPVLSAIGNKSINEGQLLSFTVSATDPDGGMMTYSASNLPSGASFNAGNRTLSWTPTYSQAGTYANVHFQVSDGTLTDSEDITITVVNINRPPVLSAIGNKSINEGQLLSFTISATDPDGGVLTYSASNLPSGASFNAGTRTFSWTPDSGMEGNYPDVLFEVSDGSLSDSESITITVGNVNHPPELGAIGDKSVDEGQILSFTISAADSDGDTLTYSASNLPPGASFNDGTRTFSWTPTYTQAGTYTGVHFQVSDGTLTDSEDITITVVNVNRPPVLSAIGDKSVDEGQLLSFTISATDPDGDTLTYSASNLPSGASFNAGTCTFSWTPASGQAGGYHGIHFEVSDGSLNDSESITITVNNNTEPVTTSDDSGDGAGAGGGGGGGGGGESDSETETNSAPVLNPIGDQSLNENDLIQFTISATDPDNDPLTYLASNLPPGASFDPQTQTFSWAPASGQAGSYLNILFKVSDGQLTDSQNIVFVVQDGTLPEIENVSVSEVTTSGVTISWSTDEPSTSQVEYWASPSELSPLNGTLVFNHLVRLIHLNPGTTYHFRTLSRDQAGNLSESGEYTFATQEAVANFTVSALNITPGEANEGQEVTVSVLVSNIGNTDGTDEVNLIMDNTAKATTSVNLAGGASQKIDFTVKTDAAGTYAVDVNGLTGMLVVKEIPVSVPGITQFGVNPVYDTATGKLISASIAFQMSELDDPIPQDALILKVFLEGQHLEDISLMSSSQLQFDGDKYSLIYLPDQGWEIGLYTFWAELYDGEQLVQVTNQENLRVTPESIAAVVSWATLGMIIGAALMVTVLMVAFLWYRHRNMYRDYI